MVYPPQKWWVSVWQMVINLDELVGTTIYGPTQITSTTMAQGCRVGCRQGVAHSMENHLARLRGFRSGQHCTPQMIASQLAIAIGSNSKLIFQLGWSTSKFRGGLVSKFICIFGAWWNWVYLYGHKWHSCYQKWPSWESSSLGTWAPKNQATYYSCYIYIHCDSWSYMWLWLIINHCDTVTFIIHILSVLLFIHILSPSLT